MTLPPDSAMLLHRLELIVANSQESLDNGLNLHKRLPNYFESWSRFAERFLPLTLLKPVDTPEYCVLDGTGLVPRFQDNEKASSKDSQHHSRHQRFLVKLPFPSRLRLVHKLGWQLLSSLG